MGMYHWIDFECVCPVCKNKAEFFQSKDGENLDLCCEVLSPTQVNNFYTSCGGCGCWLEFTKNKEGKYTRVVTSKRDNWKKPLNQYTKVFKLDEYGGNA